MEMVGLLLIERIEPIEAIARSIETGNQSS
jgi:hypothetical protein